MEVASTSDDTSQHAYGFPMLSVTCRQNAKRLCGAIESQFGACSAPSAAETWHRMHRISWAWAAKMRRQNRSQHRARQTSRVTKQRPKCRLRDVNLPPHPYLESPDSRSSIGNGVLTNVRWLIGPQLPRRKPQDDIETPLTAGRWSFSALVLHLMWLWCDAPD